MANDELLKIALSTAVPLWIDSLKTAPFDHINRRAKACSDTIAHEGDIILYKSKKAGQTAHAFNRLAEGIACLSFFPGGVKAFGMHWESVLEDDGLLKEDCDE